MFSSKGFFAQIPCPLQAECAALNCIFLHQDDLAQRVWRNMPEEDAQVEQKRRKHDDAAPEPLLATAAPRKSAKTRPFVGALVKRPPLTHSIPEDGEVEEDSSDDEIGSEVPETSLERRPISPPPLRRGRVNIHNAQIVQPAPPKPQETLNPRKLQKDPAGHQARVLYLRKLHEEIKRLNEEAGGSEDPETSALKMTDGQLITMALDEEEQIAKESPAVYANVIKLRMVAYKRMTLEQWKMMRLEARMKANAPSSNPFPEGQNHITGERPIDTGLSSKDELQVLSHLVADQKGLDQFGFVTSKPTDDDIAEAYEVVQLERNWEVCERCKSRFQVFPDRREDGLLTSGGQCRYHHGRIVFQPKEKTDSITGPKPKVYSCCNEAVGISIGCTIGDTHVFKIYDAKRLASVMQFEETPENKNIQSDYAVSFDCEMGFTVYGMELIRLTAIKWPSGEDLLDVFVRPLGTVLDLNSRYSGVTPEDFVNATPYQPSKSTPAPSEKPCIVESPFVARELLFKHLSPSTRLIGHAIENDLNATRIVHPCIVDTVILFPHPAGLPRRRALKALAKEMLWRDIQNQGAQGHDSKEDAKTTGDLVRLKVGRKWRQMQREGWTLQEGQFHAPSAGKTAENGTKTGDDNKNGKRSHEEVNDELDYGEP